MRAEHLAAVDLADNGMHLDDHVSEVVERILIDVHREPPVAESISRT
jgi:hypothetical protein